jgi:hypothetical protein
VQPARSHAAVYHPWALLIHALAGPECACVGVCVPWQEVFGHLDRIGLAAANGLYLSMPNSLATTQAHDAPSG